MAASPEFKAYFENEYRAAIVFLEDAAAFVAFLGNGAEIRLGHSRRLRLWHEGHEDFSAGESYDRAADVMRERIRDIVPHYRTRTSPGTIAEPR